MSWLLLAAGVALSAGCSRTTAPVNGPRAVVVEAPQSLSGAAGMELYPGSVHARLEADLSFRVPGKLAERKVDMGARVQPGSVLAVLDPQDARLSLDSARATLAAAEADLWLAQEEEKRYRELLARGHVGQSMVDQRANASKLAQARQGQAKAQLSLAQNQSRYTQLTADSAGVVTQVMAEAGNVLAAGQPVLRFAADGEREVHINVPEGRVEALRAAPLHIEIFTQPGKRYAGAVRELNPQADPTTRMHAARITIVGADAAVPLGATATVAALAGGDAKTFRLPATALGALASKQAVVWVVKAGAEGASTVTPVPVQVLQYLNDAVLVTGTLAASDRLVTAGVHSLVDGMPVRPIERTAKAAL